MTHNNVSVTDLEKAQAYQIKELKTQLKAVNRHLRDANRGAERSHAAHYVSMDKNINLKYQIKHLEKEITALKLQIQAVVEKSRIEIHSLLCENAALRDSADEIIEAEKEPT